MNNSLYLRINADFFVCDLWTENVNKEGLDYLFVITTETSTKNLRQYSAL